jgi:hypothetical protein
MIKTLALVVALAGCKSDPKPEPPPDEPRSLSDRARETAEAARKKAEDVARSVKDRASEAIDNAGTLRKALQVMDEQIGAAIERVSKADSDDARRLARAALDKLRAEKTAIEKQLEAIRK